MSDEEDDRSRQPGNATSIARLERDQGYDDSEEEEQPINTGKSRDARREEEEEEDDEEEDEVRTDFAFYWRPEEIG